MAAVQPEVQKRLPDILLAEDNADFADFSCGISPAAIRSIVRRTGRQALDLLRSRGIAAVVSDVAMKGMDGVALCAAIRNDPALDHLPVVLVSVDSSSAAKVRALEAGADAYLEKPLSVDYLDRQIRALIDIRGRLRLKFSKMPYLVMDGDAASPSGNRFMAQVNQYVMDNISNSNLSVEDIAAAVNVSRTLFFSRIKSLTALRPTSSAFHAPQGGRRAAFQTQRPARHGDMLYGGLHFDLLFRQVLPCAVPGCCPPNSWRNTAGNRPPHPAVEAQQYEQEQGRGQFGRGTASQIPATPASRGSTRKQKAISTMPRSTVRPVASRPRSMLW